MPNRRRLAAKGSLTWDYTTCPADSSVCGRTCGRLSVRAIDRDGHRDGTWPNRDPGMYDQSTTSRSTMLFVSATGRTSDRCPSGCAFHSRRERCQSLRIPLGLEVVEQRRAKYPFRARHRSHPGRRRDAGSRRSLRIAEPFVDRRLIVPGRAFGDKSAGRVVAMQSLKIAAPSARPASPWRSARPRLRRHRIGRHVVGCSS